MKALLIGPENPHFLGHLRTLQALEEVTSITLVASDPSDAALLAQALGEVRLGGQHHPAGVGGEPEQSFWSRLLRLNADATGRNPARQAG